MNSKIPTLIILFISGLFSSMYAAALDIEEQLVIENAWIAEAPPVSRVMVAYMTLKNTGPKAMEIVRATSDTYSSIEFHETIEKDGMATMIRHESLTVSANNGLELKRGGPHLMLFNPVRPLTAGDTVNITFATKNNTARTVTVAVKKAR
jgi:copper(I)-binding protein